MKITLAQIRSMDSTNRLNRLDIILVSGLLLFIVLYAIKYFDFSIHPFEDAAILMRYSRHFAQGKGIVWNIGDKPVDGATDFLFMILVAFLNRAGISLEIAVRLVGFFSHISTVVIIYIAIRKLYNSSPWAALSSAAYLAVGPGMGYIEAYFGTPFFALFACITWCLAIKLIRESNSYSTPLMFALSGVIMGLIRPEGVFLAILMLLGILHIKGLADSRRVILYFICVFSVIGGWYFFWRWNYFGYPLPNPFYKKGGGYLHFFSLKESIKNAIFLCLPFGLVYILGFRSSKIASQRVFSLIPITGFIGLWVLSSNEMNYLMRFQYPILPIVLISWPPAIKDIYEDWKLPKLNDLDRQSRIVFIVIILLGILVWQHGKYSRVSHNRDGRYDVAVVLNEYSHKNYTIATTEAGLLPLYSNWRAVDTWGLNDQWIVHNGGITEFYLERYRPQIIVFHAYFSPIVPIRGGGSWFKMVMTLKNYAEENGYVLAAAFGDTPYDTHYYYVRPDFAESADIIRKIRSINYYWYTTGRRSINYSMFKLYES